MSKLPFTLSAIALVALAGCASESKVAPAPAPVVVQPAPQAGTVVVPQNTPPGTAVVVPQAGTGSVVVAPTTPVPPRVEPLATVTLELAMEPFTVSAPAPIVVGPV